jgi:NADH-quinone oxidoreductase subunit M
MSKHHGLYEQSPTLAVSFLLTGLGSVGFPGTLGFVAAELLADGVVSASLFTGIVLVIAAALNGIAILRAYLLLFTGTQHESSTLLGITPLERFAVLLLTGLILGGGLFPHPGVADRHAAATTLLAGRAPNSPNESHPEAK